jgi:histidinol phosphatase-like enzyme
VEQRLAELFIENGARLSGFYCCSHHPEGTVPELSVECECRKPRPGLLLQAAADHAVDLSRSWMIGDILDDIEAGKRAGCRTILVDNGHETQWLCMPRALRTPDVIVADLDSAAQAVVDLAAGPLHAVEHAR